MPRKATAAAFCALCMCVPAERACAGTDSGHRYIAHLKFGLDGSIVFDLFEGSTGSPFYVCAPPNGRTFRISLNCRPARDPDLPPLPASEPTPACLAAVNRMAGMLQAAKMSGLRINVVHTSCEVEAVEYFQPD